MGAAATAIAPMATIGSKKTQVIPSPKPDYINQTVGSVERMRIGPGGFIMWPGTDKEFKI